MAVFSFVLVGLLVVMLGLVALGFREGDEAGDACLLRVVASRGARAVSVEVCNPRPEPVLVGMSLRRVGWRMRLEGGTYSRLATRKTTPDLLPARQHVVGVVGASESGTFIVGAADTGLARRAELVVVVGQTGRLRALHRLVTVCGPRGDDAFGSGMEGGRGSLAPVSRRLTAGS